VPAKGTGVVYFCTRNKNDAVPKSVQQSRKQKQLCPTQFRAKFMYTLNFPNGNSQTYNSLSELTNAARALGGTARCVGNKVYAFVPQK